MKNQIIQNKHNFGNKNMKKKLIKNNKIQPQKVQNHKF